LGDVEWGHDDVTDVSNIRDFTGLWTGSGIASGSGNEEIITMTTKQDMVSETWQLSIGTITAIIDYDTYRTGSGPVPTIQYKTAASRIECEAVENFTTYNGISFTCLGWVIIRVANE